MQQLRRLCDACFRYRWPIALVVLVLCVAASVSGSSINAMHRLLGEAQDPVLFGMARDIRSDEYAVSTMQALSQYWNGYGWFSELPRATPTDMFIVYGQPVLDPAVLLRPFHWGYLLLGPVRGLSFFWCARLILLFMVSLEFSYRLLAPRSRALAVSYALLVAFSSQVQWWFAINGLVEMLLFGQLALIGGHAYLKSGSYAARAAIAVGVAWCLGVFVLVFYPAWQVPFGYLFLALLAALLVLGLPGARRGWRDLAIVALALAVLIAALAYVAWRSRAAIAAELGTAYPGARLELGGTAASALFTSVASLIAPLRTTALVPNGVETSSFLSLFPLGLVMATGELVRERRRSERLDPVIIALLAVTAFLAWYACLGFPESFAHLTLLGKSMSWRAMAAVDFAQLLVMVRVLHRAREPLPIWTVAAGSVAFCAVSIAGLVSFGVVNAPDRRFVLAFTTVASLAAGAAVLWAYGRMGECGDGDVPDAAPIPSAPLGRVDALAPAMLLAFSIAAAYLGGFKVNPVVLGAGGVEGKVALSAVRDASTDRDVWAAVNADARLGNAPLAVGRKTIDCVNVYPNLELWRKLDPTGAFEQVYNRYAHVSISLVADRGQTPLFQLMAPDAFTVTVTADELRILGVTRVLSTDGELEGLSSPATRLTRLSRAGSVFIYRVDHSDA